jgi:hypothetical protein
MLANGITAVKTALLHLQNSDGAAIFTLATEIFTGFPHADLISHDSPVEKEPLVATYFYGKDLAGVGHKDLLRREDVPGVPIVRRDEDSLADMIVNCDVYVLAKKTDELVGTAAWEGYVEQVLRIVRTHSEIIGPRDTIITWDLDTFDIPGEYIFPQDRRLFLGIVKTLLTGRFVDAPLDGGRITEIVPYLDDFMPVMP